MYGQAASNDFPGLDLVSAPDGAGCIDCLNVDLDQAGAVRVRDGWVNFTTSAAARPYVALGATASPTTRILAARGNAAGTGYEVDAISLSNGVVAGTYATGGSSSLFSFANFGVPGTASTYIGEYDVTIRKYVPDTATFSAPTATVDGVAGRAMPKAALITVMPADNRLVAAYATVGPHTATSDFRSQVWFSDEGNAESWTTTNYVQLTPGDGESILAAVTWGDLVIVFKETRAFVFYGNTTGSDGVTEFNYRTISLPDRMFATNAVAVAPEGVYFVTARGLWLTDGGTPRLVSARVEPLFTGPLPTFFTGATSTIGAGLPMHLAWHNGRVYLAFQQVAAANNYVERMLVYDPRDDQWTVWTTNTSNLAGLGLLSSPTGGTLAKSLLFCVGTANHIGKYTSGATTDNGTAIASYYRTGFQDFGTDEEKRIVKTRPFGTGAVDVKWSRDFEALGTAKTATLGTSPAITQAVVDSNAKKGRLFSWQLGASSGPWTVHRVLHELDPASPPDVRTP